MKKFKFILSVLLSFLIVFSVFPSTVYADYTNDLSFNFEFESSYGNKYVKTAKSNVSVTSEPIFVKNLETASISSGFNVSCERGDLVTVNFEIVKTNLFDYRGQFGINFDDTIFKIKSGSDVVILSDGYNEFSCVFECLRDTTNYHFNLVGYITPISYNESVKDSYFTITCSGNYSVTDEKTGLLNSILEWLENIRDKIVNLPSEFGSFITDLKTNLSSWFNDLKSNISQWFSDVGDWFVDLGDNIGGFFTDLWDNISLKFETINTDISNWWQGVKDWFHSLFVPEDGWVEDYKKRIDSFLATHLGMVYEAPRLISLIFTLILGAFNKPANGSVIIPRITIPGTSYVLIDYTEFNLNTIINSNERFKWMYDTFKIASSAILFLFVLNYCRKELDEFLKDREVSE